MFSDPVSNYFLIHEIVVEVFLTHVKLQIVMFLAELSVKRVYKYLNTLSHRGVLILFIHHSSLVHVLVERFKNLTTFRVVRYLRTGVKFDIFQQVLSNRLDYLESEYCRFFTEMPVFSDVEFDRIYRTVSLCYYSELRSYNTFEKFIFCE